MTTKKEEEMEEGEKKRNNWKKYSCVFWKCRGIERIGEESPASTIATDTFVLKEIAQLVKHAEEEEIDHGVCGGM